MSETSIEEILDALAPEMLRAKVALPLEEIREEFMARFLTTESYDEFIAEMARFVRHVKKRWLKTDVEWPDEHAEAEAMRLLEESVGVKEAMKAVRYCDRGGLRWILDRVATHLQREGMTQYLDSALLPKIEGLPWETSVEVARRYLDTFHVPGVRRENAELLAANWRVTLHRHVQVQGVASLP